MTSKKITISIDKTDPPPLRNTNFKIGFTQYRITWLGMNTGGRVYIIKQDRERYKRGNISICGSDEYKNKLSKYKRVIKKIKKRPTVKLDKRLAIEEKEFQRRKKEEEDNPTSAILKQIRSLLNSLDLKDLWKLKTDIENKIKTK